MRLNLPSGFDAIFRGSTASEVGSNGFEAARPCTFRTACAHSNIIKIKMQNRRIQHYNGYAVQSSAHRLSDGSFSSNLLLERIDSARAEGRYRFCIGSGCLDKLLQLRRPASSAFPDGLR
ncbi:hypothetical protein EVC45_34935, partial [Paraburkholderia sp. UYCP14C]